MRGVVQHPRTPPRAPARAEAGALTPGHTRIGMRDLEDLVLRRADPHAPELGEPGRIRERVAAFAAAGEGERRRGAPSAAYWC